MGKYSREYTNRRSERKWEIHPIWRGLGFVLIILIFFSSAIAARQLVNMNRASHWISLSGGIDNPVNLVITFELLPKPIDLNWLINWMPGYPFRISELIVFVACLFILYGLLSTVYAALWRTMAPVRDPFDAPEYDQRIRRRK